MPVWIDDNHIEGEMSDTDFLTNVNRLMTARVEREIRESRTGRNTFGNDGNVEVYSEVRTDRGVSFKLSAIRYWAVSREPNGTFPIRRNDGMNAIGKWAVVEPTTGSRPLSYELSRFLGLDDLLYHDTLLSGQEDWTLRQQWAEMERQATEDVSVVLALRDTFEARVQEMRAEMEKALMELGTEATP